MLKQRVITALVLLPIALAGFFWLDGGAFALFIGAVVSLGGWEWARLAGFSSQPMRVAYGLLVAALLYGLYLAPALAPLVLVLGVLWWGAATILVLGYPETSRYWGGTPGKLVIGLPSGQKLLLEVRNDSAGCSDTPERAADIECEPMRLVRALFGPAPAQLSLPPAPKLGLLQGWCPLPLAISEQDHV